MMFVSPSALMAIFQGEEIYEIDLSKCTECVGHYETSNAQRFVPWIVFRSILKETREELLHKYHKLTGQ